MGYIFHKTDLGHSIETEYGKTLTSVKIFDHLTGLEAKGYSKLHPDDTFNLNVGVTLAFLRAQQRLLRKIEKRVASKPEVFADERPSILSA